jgi:hypothetical protein
MELYMTTQDFWTKSKLSHVETLIKSYDGYIERASEDFKELYVDDQADFRKAVEHFRKADDMALSDHIQYMDTDPRENLIVAFAEDLGKQWVELTLGYSVTNGV